MPISDVSIHDYVHFKVACFDDDLNNDILLQGILLHWPIHTIRHVSVPSPNVSVQCVI